VVVADLPATLRAAAGGVLNGPELPPGAASGGVPISAASTRDSLNRRCARVPLLLRKDGIALRLRLHPCLVAQPKNVMPRPDSAQPSPEDATNAFAALGDLGLRLEATTGPVDIIVIEHVEQPSEN
jgi:hypothetical protein